MEKYIANIYCKVCKQKYETTYATHLTNGEKCSRCRTTGVAIEEQAMKVWEDSITTNGFEGFVSRYAAYIHKMIYFLMEAQISIIPNAKVRPNDKIKYFSEAAKRLNEIGDPLNNAVLYPSTIDDKYKVKEEGNFSDQTVPSFYIQNVAESSFQECHKFLAELIKISRSITPILPKLVMAGTGKSEYKSIKKALLALAKQHVYYAS